MSRNYHNNSIAILRYLANKIKPVESSELRKGTNAKLSEKDFYNYVFRLLQQELVSKDGRMVSITADGRKLLGRLVPEKDGVWKLVIFDIPEKHKYVRSVLRGKLKQLHFKKWQNSIWVSPYRLDEEIEKEFEDLGKKFFVRLIKTSHINHTQDLEKMFA